MPDFENYVWDRTGDNSLSIIKGFYHGGGIRGINVDDPYVFSNENIFNMKIDQTLPKIPGKLFFDVANMLHLLLVLFMQIRCISNSINSIFKLCPRGNFTAFSELRKISLFGSVNWFNRIKELSLKLDITK